MSTAATGRTTLLSLFNDLLVLGTSLKTAADCGDPQSLRSHLLERLYQANQAGNDMGMPRETLRLARYAVAAYLDEMVMMSQWPKKRQWPTMSLQSELFSTETAGQGFFQFLEEIWREHPQNADLLELYYLCLALGFEGKYKVQGRDQLKALIQDLGRDLQAKRGDVPPLSPGQPLSEPTARSPKQAAVPWLMAAAGIGLAVVLYVTLLVNSGWDAEAVAVHLNELTEKVDTVNR